MVFSQRAAFFLVMMAFVILPGYTQPPPPGHGEDDDQEAGAFSQFSVTINTPNPVAGENISITIRAENAAGDLIETFGGKVDLTVNDNTFIDGFDTESGNFIEGIYTMNIGLKEANNITIISAVNAEEGENQSGESDPFEVFPGPVNSFRVLEYDSDADEVDEIGPQRAGEPFTLHIRALDEFENKATGFGETVVLDTDDNAFEDGVDDETPAFADGFVRHEVSLKELSDNTSITATRTGETETGTSATFEVTAGKPDYIEIVQQPQSWVLAGEPMETAPQIRVADKFGHPIEGIEVKVELNKNQFSSSTTTEVHTDAHGKATFEDLIIDDSGDDYFMIFSANDFDVEKESQTIIVVSEGASHMIVYTQPETSVAGESIAGPPAVQLLDDFDNGVPDIEITVSLIAGTMTGTFTLETDEDGVAEFDDLVIEESGEGYVLEFDADAAGVDDIETEPFDVGAAAVDYFTVTATDGDNIPGQTSGVPFTIQISAFDEFDNLAEHFDGAVTLSTNNSFGSQVQETTNNFVDGVLDSYPVTLCDVSDDYSITATNSASGEGQEGSSNDFSVQAGYGQLLYFDVTAPGDDPIGTQVAGTPFPVEITARDQCGNRVEDFEEPVTLATNNAFGVSVVTETAALVDGRIETGAEDIYLRDAAEDAVITASYNGYTGTSNAFGVDPRPVIITVNTATRTYAEEGDYSFQDFGDQLMAGDEVADVTGGTGVAADITFETGTDLDSDVGTYTEDIGIDISSLDGDRAFSYDPDVVRGMLTIVQATPQIIQWPLAHLMVTLPLEEAEFFDAETDVPGTFAFVDGDFVLEEEGEYAFEAVFTPDDTHNYEEVVGTVSLTVGPYIPLAPFAFLVMIGLVVAFVAGRKGKNEE